MSILEAFDLRDWSDGLSDEAKKQLVAALEDGKIIYFPQLQFKLAEHEVGFLSADKVDPKSKNISYDPVKDRLAGALYEGAEAEQLKQMVKRFSTQSRQLIERLIPHYTKTLMQAKTSFRPVEIAGRKSSYRKDDTRLHVDAFPSNPTKGKRILRFFSNINHMGKPRVWRAGEPFRDVVAKIAPRANSPFPGSAQLLKLLGITKDLRTPYDHYMLQIHDAMKKDDEYQKLVPQEEIAFPPGCCWLVYTDQVSHAAMSGQHVLEQTYHLPAHGLKHPENSPLRILEKHFSRPLI